ncbi:MAG: amidohydrolase family protein [Myxococcales bacterium]|nr:amidohydrolase family protein [Myxococcales bacterium]
MTQAPEVLIVDHLFDGRRFVPGEHEVTLAKGFIRAVRPRPQAESLPPGARDLRGGTLLPGLIDAHCHLARVGLFEPHEAPHPRSVAENLSSALRAGITTAGDMGCPAPMITALRSHTEAERDAGPAIRSAGPLLTVPLGYPLDWMSQAHVWLGAAIPCGDERSARRAVARVAAAGMDHVKICIMHRAYDLTALPTFSRKVARGVVEEAHALGLRVLAHAHWSADYRVALAAGVDALMHSAFDPLDDELVARVAGSGVSVCPTLWVFHSACLGAEERWDREPGRLAGVTAPVRRSWRRFAEAFAVSGDVLPDGIAGGLPKSAARDGVRNAIANLLLLRERGVPFAYGSDGPYGFSTVFRPFEELELLARAGLGIDECLAAATSGAAQLLGATDRGVIQPGARADLVWVDGDLSSELGALRRVQRVMRQGRWVSDAGALRPRVERTVWRGLADTLRSAVVSGLLRSGESI